MEQRKTFRQETGGSCVPAVDGADGFCVAVAAPVISEVDVMGCVLFVTAKNTPPVGDVEFKLAQTVSAFLGKQMES